MSDMVMFRGDLKPDLRLTVTDRPTPGADPVPVDFTNAVSMTVRGRRHSTLLFDRAASGNAAGEVTMQWEIGDTVETGPIQIDVRVIWPGNKPQTYRATGNVMIRDA